MIVKNEKQVLKRCLKSIAPCVDEIVIVDTGSTDNTKEIAKKFTNNIFDFKWINDFSAARNFAFSKATMPYVMWLDADDVVAPKEQIKLLELKKTLSPEIANVQMKYDITFDENGITTFSYYRERLFKNKCNPVWMEPIHEYVFCPGKILKTDITIMHKKEIANPAKRNLKIFEDMKKKKLPFSSRMIYYYGRELYYNGKPKKALTEFNRFLKQKDAWHTNKIEACVLMAQCWLQLNNKERAIQLLLQSFSYDLPTGEALCKLGEIYFSNNQLETSAYWFELALTKATRPQGGFLQEDYYGYIPAINLCVIYDRLGNKLNASHYNNIAGSYKPNDKAFLHNKKLYENLNDK